MAIRTFAKIDKATKEVLAVKVRSDTKPGGLDFDDNFLWVETWSGVEPGIASYRYNYAGIGNTYYEDADAFIAPNPGVGTSRVLDTTTYQWVPSSPRPEVLPQIYTWNDDYCQWVTYWGPGNNGGIENSTLITDLKVPGSDDHMDAEVPYDEQQLYAPDGTKMS
jgi:hypothetical protein